jgi:putative phosphoesterase
VTRCVHWAMRIAAFYDIHGNLPALEAVMTEMRHVGVDRIVVGGDVLPGPLPRETLAFLRGVDRPVDFIRGNGEAAVLAQITGENRAAIPAQARDIIEWTAAQLDSHDAQMIALWPPTHRIELEGRGVVLFCHATPRNDAEIFTRLTDEGRLRDIFDIPDVNVVVCGHTHMQFDRRIGQTRVVNAGSVGMPFGARGAYWMVVGTGRESGASIELRRTTYDFSQAALRIRASSYPHAEQFAVGNILQPPSEAAMLEAFTRVELQR